MSTRPFNREHKREALVEAASAVFAEQGFASTRVSDIAERAGVAKGTVYEYFRSKEELFYEVFKWFNRGIREDVTEVLADHESPREQLIALCKFGGHLIVEHRDLYPMMNVDLWVTSRGSEFAELFAEAVGEEYRAYRELLTKIIRAGQASGDFRIDVDAVAVATLLVSTFDGLGLQYWIDDSIDPIGSSEEFVLALCRGLCPEEK
jgi:AcrR family transcriptional regulator